MSYSAFIGVRQSPIIALAMASANEQWTGSAATGFVQRRFRAIAAAVLPPHEIRQLSKTRSVSINTFGIIAQNHTGGRIMRDQQRSIRNNGVTGAHVHVACSAAFPLFAATRLLRASFLRIS
ncbi:hypothetical protein ACPUER_28870 [Burkholderia sp. DN3021]|uniref:hypothetical protein n=1 Tax=Burkholderia sp. DN3021 TaxID=3410137 RepID=UPI00285AAE58|nr:hypothetical protein [Burkholderia ambifaria]MDR6499269.1 hypothetical protein [Burkholderia ambifaria]